MFRTHVAFAILAASTAIGLAIGCSCARKHEVRAAGSGVKLSAGDPRTRCPAALLSAREGGSDAGRYVVPTDDERATMREAMRKLVAEGWSARGEVSSAIASIGYELIDVAEIGDAVLLRELPDHKRGGGAYVVRPASRSRLLVQAPHTFFDEGTLPLGCELFQRSAAHGFFIDTAHRYKSADPLPNGDSPADVAHAQDSLFQAATEGFFAATHDVRVVQLHGFSKRDSGAMIVLSSGDKQQGLPLVDDAFQRLEKIVQAGVMRFPAETTDLGATQNVQGTFVRNQGGAFLHVEMAAPLRRDLLSNPQRRAEVIGAIVAALEDA